LALFLATTGCRISEALNARWGDFGPDDNGRIVVHVTVSKTEAAIRSVPLSEDMAQRLARRWSEARYAGDGDPIFASATGTVIDARNWRRRVFSQAAKAAGVPWATPHLGHADGGVLALRTYIHSDGLDSTDFIDSAFRVDPAVAPDPSVDPSVDPELADTPNP
jgi:integrase